MQTTTIVWAGKPLSGLEEARLRRLVHTLQRVGNDELAAEFERFLPERADDWSFDECVNGASAGRWLRVEATLDPDVGEPKIA